MGEGEGGGETMQISIGFPRKEDVDEDVDGVIETVVVM